MQAIEFEAQLNNGVIQLPAAFHHWHEGRKVKVIVLDDDIQTTEQQNISHPTISQLDGAQSDLEAMMNPQKPRDINRHAGKITLTQDPLAFQQAMRDEWA